MNEVWMLDYLHAVFPRMGVFESEEAAWRWVELNDSARRDFYTPFSMQINRVDAINLHTTSPYTRYSNQR